MTVPKRGPGRPALGAAGRTVVLRTRVTPATDALVTLAAERAGVTVTDWLREAIELALARGSTR